MPNMHVFSNVRRWEVNNDSLQVFISVRKSVSDDVHQLIFKEWIFDGKVKERRWSSSINLLFFSFFVCFLTFLFLLLFLIFGLLRFLWNWNFENSCSFNKIMIFWHTRNNQFRYFSDWFVVKAIFSFVLLVNSSSWRRTIIPIFLHVSPNLNFP